MNNLAAPKCSQHQCKNRTWEGVCYAHRGERAIPADLVGMTPAPASQYRQDGDAAALWDDISTVFQDIGDIVHPYAVREQVTETIRGAVSIELLRRVDAHDLPDPAARDAALRQARLEVVEQIRLQPNTIGASEAAELMNSSVDAYGRGLDDCRALASYALRMEWNLGQVTAVQEDEFSVPYRVEFEDFARVAGEQLNLVALDQFGREMAAFDQTVRSLRGRGPLDPSPISQDLTLHTALPPDELITPYEQELASHIRVAREAQRQTERAQAAKQARNERSKAMFKEVGLAALNWATDADGQRLEKARRAEKAQRDAQWDELRELWRRQATARQRASRRW